MFFSIAGGSEKDSMNVPLVDLRWGRIHENSGNKHSAQLNKASRNALIPVGRGKVVTKCGHYNPRNKV